MYGIEDLFDLDGDRKLNGVEMAFAYSAIFGTEEEEQPEFDGLNDSFDEEQPEFDAFEDDFDADPDEWDW